MSLILLLSSCSKENETIEQSDIDSILKKTIMEHSPNNSLSYFILPESQNLGEIPQDPNNPLTAEKVALGAFLFHETALGSNPKNMEMLKTYSCSSCHHSEAGFQSGAIQGVGEGGVGFGVFGEDRAPNMNMSNHDAQPIRTPSIINGAFQENVTWSGQFGSRGMNKNKQDLWKTNTPLEVNRYNFDGIESHSIAALDIHRMGLDQSMLEMTAYKNLFDIAFEDVSVEERYTEKYAGLALAAFQRTVLANQSPWQSYLKGDETALSNDEKEGAELFFGKANCVSCHTGPALNSMEFYALGFKDLVDCDDPTLNTSIDDKENLGRGGFTTQSEDMYKFKVPQLYNLKGLNYLGHGSSFSNVREIIEYKNKGVAENNRVPHSQLAEAFEPLNLSSTEIDKLTIFIEHSLYDHGLDRYVPDQLPSGLCFPNADIESMEDMGCL